MFVLQRVLVLKLGYECYCRVDYNEGGAVDTILLILVERIFLGGSVVRWGR